MLAIVEGWVLTCQSDLILYHREANERFSMLSIVSTCKIRLAGSYPEGHAKALGFKTKTDRYCIF